jgi:dTDP-4-amino-4,6-dideoxygalactose transaminase
MATLLIGLGPGDEVIMPSFTFVSCANAVVLRGATPVFVDIRHDTLNIDETLIEAAITPRTRAIMPMHYAGVPCAMGEIMAIAQRHGLYVVEDAAQALLSNHNGRSLGTIGHLGTISFHETKNIISGEGGALLINDPELEARAEIIREKGTDRAQFFRGQVDKYTWRDIGSSFLPGEIVAAFLWAQLEESPSILARRLAIWQRYHHALAALESAGYVRRPNRDVCTGHNGHIFYLIMADLASRTQFIAWLASRGIQAVFHYVPLHLSPMGKTKCRVNDSLPVTEILSDRLVRLPLWIGLETRQQEVIDAVFAFFGHSAQ